MKKSRTTTILIVIFSNVYFIGNAWAQRTKYTFLEQTIITQLDYSCLEFSELTIMALSQGDKVLLDMMSDSVVDSAEIRFGAEALTEMRNQLIFFEDERTKRLRNILQKMLPYVSRNAIEYKIFLVEDSKEPNLLNAWTHSGGQIYFTTSMLNFCQSDDEIACIIGHEIGHNENRHCAVHFRRISITNGIWNFFTNENNESVSQLGAKLYEIIFTAFNQKQELESDRTGVYLAYIIGYNPEAALNFFDRLAKDEKQEAFMKFFRSHPYSETRKRCLKNYLSESKR